MSRIAAWLASPHRFPTSSLYVPRHARPANIARRSEVDLQQSAKSPQEFQQQSPAFLDSQRTSDASSPGNMGPASTCQR